MSCFFSVADPQFNSKLPADLGLESSDNSWDKVKDVKAAAKAKTLFQAALLRKIIMSDADSSVLHSPATTRVSPNLGNSSGDASTSSDVRKTSWSG